MDEMNMRYYLSCLGFEEEELDRMSEKDMRYHLSRLEEEEVDCKTCSHLGPNGVCTYPDLCPPW